MRTVVIASALAFVLAAGSVQGADLDPEADLRSTQPALSAAPIVPACGYSAITETASERTVNARVNIDFLQRERIVL
jgi:hypothetical protein